MCVILSPYPSWFTAAAESPPPMIVTASVSASAFATASVPCAKFGISKQPIGPFHTTVLASFTASQKIFSVSGPISSPCHPSGISPLFTTFLFAPLEKSSAMTVSTGRRSFTPFSCAFFNMSSAYWQ